MMQGSRSIPPATRPHRLLPVLLAVISLSACVETAPAPAMGPVFPPATYPGTAAPGPGYFPAASAPASVTAGSGAQISLRSVPAARPGPQAVPAAYGARPPTAESTGSGAELAYVRDLLAELQIRSFRENREFCGYIGLDPSGNLTRTEINGGTEASCPLPPVPPGMRLLASFHTHSTYSPFYASEFPTAQDMASDAAFDIDGYISTPGGRLWYTDSDTMTVRQICGRGCLPQDPNYRPQDDGPLQAVFTYNDLLRLSGL